MKCIGKVKTEKYVTSKGFTFKKQFIIVASLCVPEERGAIMSDKNFSMPVNLETVKDGLYSLELEAGWPVLKEYNDVHS